MRWLWYVDLGARVNNMKRPLIRENLNVIQNQSQEADATFITSDDS